MSTIAARRATPALVAAMLAASLLLVANSGGPGAVRALDGDPVPTPTASVEPSPIPDPSPAATEDPAPTIVPAVDPLPSPEPSAPATADTSPPPSPDPSVDPGPTVTPAPSPEPTVAPAPSPDPSVAPAPTVAPAPSPVTVALDLASEPAVTVGGRIEPQSVLLLVATVTPDSPLDGAWLSIDVPAGWTVETAAGGVVVDSAVTWTLPPVTESSPISRSLRVRAPAVPVADGRFVLEGSFVARLSQPAGPATEQALSVVVAPRLVVDSVSMARLDDTRPEARYLPSGTWVLDAGRFQSVRVRFRVWNPSTEPVHWTPQLEARTSSSPFAAVPSRHEPGAALYSTQEWRSTSGGTKPGPTSEPILPAAMLGAGSPPTSGPAVNGIRLMGRAVVELDLPALGWTEVEVTVRTSADAEYGAVYELRLTDGGSAFPGASLGSLGLGPAPRVALSPGQLPGIPATDADTGVTGVRYALVLTTSPVAAPRLAADSGARYRLAAGGASPVALAGSTFTSPHGGYAATTPACAACHRDHSAAAGYLAAAAAPAAVCFSCHDGSGADNDVAARYADPGIPANDEATSAYYRHDAPNAGAHTSAVENEWQSPAGTPVLNRHAGCADCHDSHRAGAGESVPGPDGWSAAGAVTGISGVAVTNGAAGSAPTYTSWTSSDTAYPIERGYELCLKCHSGFTQLPAHDPDAPSTWALDKGIEMNPANGSGHPVEAVGTNGTAAMAASLAGTSPYKQWNYLVGDTVRCENCHADPARFNAAAPPAAGSDLAPHASENRGILFQRYVDRTLEPATRAYDAGDFALCYVCHAEAPFRDPTGEPRPDTNFQYHGKHVSALLGKGDGGTSIDTPGAGEGNATCAECHFRIHSTALAYRATDRSNERLVNFAPNVVAAGSAWARTRVAAGTCTLTCHQESHADSYGPITDPVILAVVATPASFSSAGDVITYRFVVTNATLGTISGPVSIADSPNTGAACPPGDLGSGETVTCVGAYVVTSTDVTAGSLSITATATAGVSASNTATSEILLSP